MNQASSQLAMPYGSVILSDGTVIFRLWAPAAEQVEVCLADEAAGALRSFAMTPAREGWYELALKEAGAGSHYSFLINGEQQVPDPASRFQPLDTHGPSEVIDPAAFTWQDSHWKGRPWEEAVIYELHVGCFSQAGSFAAVREKLDYLVDLGVTAIELLPVADFPGRRNWGYDGTLLFAPDSSYGRPEDLKALVDDAHRHGLMVLMDVVYNHFGPDGNYLPLYAPGFFNPRHRTPWGDALNFDGEDRHWVREFFIHNALYWLEEFHMDGLRLDAVHAIMDADDSEPDFLTDLGKRVRDYAHSTDRQIHLVLENDHNTAHYLARGEEGELALFTAQWNDDIHHILHLLLTGEEQGYYADYRDQPLALLGRCLSEGFAYQGEMSAYRDNARRGEASGQLPPAAFVSFLQNHDHIGNRACGERITSLASADALRAMTALLLLSPAPPLLFMGQEWGSEGPFLFFCDFTGDLAEAVREGRRKEFAHFPAFSDAAARERIPDPTAEQSFADSKLRWEEARCAPHADWLALHRELLHLRATQLHPRLRGMGGGQAPSESLDGQGLCITWRLGDGSVLTLWCNLADKALPTDRPPPAGRLLYGTHDPAPSGRQSSSLPPWSLYFFLNEGKSNR